MLVEILATGEGYHDICERLRASGGDDPPPKVRALMNAFGYHLLEHSQVDGREREQAPYGPMMEFDNRRFPPRLMDIEEAELAVWAEAFEAVDNARLRSRLGDLLWVRRFGDRPDLLARAAIDAM